MGEKKKEEGNEKKIRVKKLYLENSNHVHLLFPLSAESWQLIGSWVLLPCCLATDCLWRFSGRSCSVVM